MNSDIIVSELASMAADNEKRCQVWHPVQGVILTAHLMSLTDGIILRIRQLITSQ
jgi:hypothetical protein